MRKILLFAAVATMFVACTKDEMKDAVSVKPIDKFYATIGEEDSRVQLNGEGETVWTNGDRVSVFNQSTDNCSYAFTGKTGDRSGDLSYVEGGMTGEAIDQIVAVYPYNSANAIATDGTISTIIPARQTYCKESFGVGSSIMVARTNNEKLLFRNVMGWIRVALTGEKTIKNITFQGNNNELIAGDVTIKSDWSVTMASNATNILTLDYGEGVELSKDTPTYFYIAVPPQTFEKGVSVCAADTDGNMVQLAKSGAITIARNHIVPMASFECAIKEDVSAKQIAYTTSGNEPITPKSYTGNIVSHIFESGRGVITFDSEQTEIGDSAFRDCTGLTGITIPNGVTAIGKEAFKGCSGLTGITIPDGVTTIGEEAFRDCAGLKGVYITDIAAWCNIKFDGFDSNPVCCAYNLYLNGELITDLVIPDGITEINNFAFENCRGLTSVTIPDSVTKIGDKAFYFCNGLTSITIPNSVTEIDSAFGGCTGLTSITIPDSVTTIGDAAFYGCTGLTSITIPDSVTTIGYWAFRECTGLTSITIPGCVTTIGDATFRDCTGLTSITIPDSVTEIGEEAFRGCTGLTYADIRDGVTEIGEDAFRDCKSLARVDIGNSVTTIGRSAFRGCKSLARVYIGNSVTTICDSAFADCTGLEIVIIGTGVTGIGWFTFNGCTSLTSIYCKPTTPPFLENGAFDNISSDAIIYVPRASAETYKSRYDWDYYASQIYGYDF